MPGFNTELCQVYSRGQGWAAWCQHQLGACWLSLPGLGSALQRL